MKTPTHKALTPTGQWVEGWFDCSAPELILWVKSETTGIPTSILPETLCRATYRTDSNGKMMYEGDYVLVEEWVDGMKGYSGVYRIEYTNCDCAFYLIDDNKQGEHKAITFNEMDTYTLTGKNIHDKTEGK